MRENNEPAAERTGAPDQTPASHRKIFGTRRISPPPARGPERPELEEKLASLVDSVKILSTQISDSNEADAMDRPGRRGGRFQRVGVEEAAALPVEVSRQNREVRGTETIFNKNIAWPGIARRESAADGNSRKHLSLGQRYPFILNVVVYTVGFLLIGFGYLLGQGSEEDTRAAGPRSSARPKPATLLSSLGVSDQAFRTVNEALKAEKIGDDKTARNAYETAVGQQLHVPGAEYRLAMMDFQRKEAGYRQSAELHLDHSMAAGEEMAPSYYAQAAFDGMKGDYNDAVTKLAAAARVEPFSARYCFYWGEALRRSGKLRAASDALEQALDRPTSTRDAALIKFKLRLAQIQLGHDYALDVQIDLQLQQVNVGGDWLMLAAARDLLHAAYPAAADHLQKAAHALPAATFNAWVRDYIFQGYANRPGIGALVKVEAPAPQSVLVDPDVLPAEEGDPATWAPFTPAN